MKLIKEPVSAEARCRCCGRVYLFSVQEYQNTFCKSSVYATAITASTISLCKSCGVGMFELIKVNYSDTNNSDWISVADRLPSPVNSNNDFDLKLVYDTSISHYHLASFWEDGKWRLTNGIALDKVTHWMDIPKVHFQITEQ